MPSAVFLAGAFTVNPEKDHRTGHVTIETALPVRDAIAGSIDGWMVERRLQGTYREELNFLARHVAKQ